MSAIASLFVTLTFSGYLLLKYDALHDQPKFSDYKVSIDEIKIAPIIWSPRWEETVTRYDDIALYMSQGASFAGHFTVVQLSCGTFCSYLLVGNRINGKIIDVELVGGEYQPILEFKVRPDSRLMITQWGDHGECHRDYWIFDGNKFTLLLSKAEAVNQYGECANSLELLNN